ncbi:MAG: tail fiber domain-containing protein [Desulfurellales bacterium]|nr:MAG: tail fiber domain-containing protein [Desulfurellales bacterium]
MSFGFRLKNGSQDVLASESTYSAYYIGTAAFDGYDYYYPYLSPDLLGDWSMHSLRFKIASDTPVLPFVACSDYAAIAEVLYSGGIATIYISVRTSAIVPPTVHCFAKRTTNPTLSGYGMALYDSSGLITFDTASDMLRPAFVVNAFRGYSGVYWYNDGTYVGNRCNSSAYSTFATSATITSPALMYAMPASAAGGNFGIQDFFENLIKFDSGYVRTVWNRALHTFGSTNFQCGSGYGLCIGIDAAIYSDRRLKENIVLVGKDEATGLNLYEYNYVDGIRGPVRFRPATRFRGVMADEVQALYPEAVVTTPLGFLAVRYDLLGLEMIEVPQ